jgi:hypothetical protein
MTMSMAGIDRCFTAHSTRSASATSAAQEGLSVETILEAADWGSAETFEQFYHRPSSKREFATAVLDALST